MTHRNPTSKDVPNTRLRRIEVRLGYLLRVGVGISVVLLVGGVFLSLIRHPGYMTDAATMAQVRTDGEAFPHSIQTLTVELRQVRGRAIIALGLLVLIATPVVRVGVSVVAFLIERDWRFAVITALVFLVLALSAFLGGAR